MIDYVQTTKPKTTDRNSYILTTVNIVEGTQKRGVPSLWSKM